MLDIILLLLGLVGLCIGSVTDLQRREVPDFINFGLISLAIGIRLIYAISSNSWLQLIFSISGALLCFGIACIFFYSGQWGGGDAKMLIALGALFATYTPVFFHPIYTVPAFMFAILPMNLIQYILDYNLFFIIYLIINILIAGAVYGTCWSIYLAIKNRPVWWQEVLRQTRTTKIKIIGFLTIVCIVMLLYISTTLQTQILKDLIISLCAIVFFGFILQLTITSVEKSCMIKPMLVEKITEGEWIQKDVFIRGKYVCGPKDLGITEKQIKILKTNKIKSVIVKVGIPFIPAFLLGLIVTVTFGNIFAFILV